MPDIRDFSQVSKRTSARPRLLKVRGRIVGVGMAILIKVLPSSKNVSNFRQTILASEKVLDGRFIAATGNSGQGIR